MGLQWEKSHFSYPFSLSETRGFPPQSAFTLFSRKGWKMDAGNVEKTEAEKDGKIFMRRRGKNTQNDRVSGTHQKTFSLETGLSEHCGVRQRRYSEGEEQHHSNHCGFHLNHNNKIKPLKCIIVVRLYIKRHPSAHIIKSDATIKSPRLEWCPSC